MESVASDGGPPCRRRFPSTPLDGHLGDLLSASGEVEAKEIKPSLDPADEGLVGVLFEAQSATCARTA